MTHSMRMSRIIQVTSSLISTPWTHKVNRPSILERMSTKSRVFMISNRNIPRNMRLNNSKTRCRTKMLLKSLRTHLLWILMRGRIRLSNMNSKVHDRAENMFHRKNRREDHLRLKGWALTILLRSRSRLLKTSSSFTNRIRKSNKAINRTKHLNPNILQISRLPHNSIMINNPSRIMMHMSRGPRSVKMKFIQIRVSRANRYLQKTLHRTSILIHTLNHQFRMKFFIWRCKVDIINRQLNIDLLLILSTVNSNLISLLIKAWVPQPTKGPWKILRPLKLRRGSKVHTEQPNKLEWEARVRLSRENRKLRSIQILTIQLRKKSISHRNLRSIKNRQGTDLPEPCNSSLPLI